MIATKEFQGWHHGRIEALLVDVAARLRSEREAVVPFYSPRPKVFQQAVLQQLDWSGYAGRFEADRDSGLPKLIVRHKT